MSLREVPAGKVQVGQRILFREYFRNARRVVEVSDVHGHPEYVRIVPEGMLAGTLRWRGSTVTVEEG